MSRLLHPRGTRISFAMCRARNRSGNSWLSSCKQVMGLDEDTFAGGRRQHERWKEGRCPWWCAREWGTYANATSCHAEADITRATTTPTLGMILLGVLANVSDDCRGLLHLERNRAAVSGHGATMNTIAGCEGITCRQLKPSEEGRRLSTWGTSRICINFV